MFAAFLYLTARTALNRTVRQIKRIRSPRYAIALIIGVLYIWFMFAGRGSPTGGGPLSMLTSETGQNIGTLLVFVFLAWPWIFGSRTDALAFTPAELHFLFPAPVSRRGLILYKVLRSQLAVFFSTLIWIVLIRRGGSDISPLMRGIGLWILFSTFSLHRLGASLFRASIIEHGAAGVRRQRIVSLVVAVVLAALAFATFTAYQSVAASQPDFRFSFAAVSTILQQPLLHALLTPFRAIAQVALVSSFSSWLASVPLALAILLLHVAWVVSANVAFEEAAADASARLAQRIADFRARGRAGTRLTSEVALRRTLRLSPTGRPEFAIIWKNMLGFLRSLRISSLLPFAVMALAFVIVLGSSGRPDAIRALGATMLLSMLALTVLFGPRFVRNDLRTDLAQLSLLKTYPLASASIVGAEVASATISLTVPQALLVVPGLYFVPGIQTLGRLDVLLIGVGGVLAIAAVNALNMSIQNGAALMFPAWMTIGPNRPTGVEALGQNILLAFATIFLLALALIPVFVAGGVTFLGLVSAGIRLRVALVTLVSLSVLFLEIAVLVMLLGRLFERTDPTAVS